MNGLLVYGILLYTVPVLYMSNVILTGLEMSIMVKREDSLPLYVQLYFMCNCIYILYEHKFVPNSECLVTVIGLDDLG